MSTNSYSIIASRLALISLSITTIKAFLYPSPLWNRPVIIISLAITTSLLIWQALSIAKRAKWAIITFLLFLFIGAAENLYHYKKIIARLEQTPVQESFNLICWGLSIAAAYLIFKQPEKTSEQHP